MKTVLIPTEFKRINKTRWPQYVKEFLESPDSNSIHAERGSKIAYHKFNTDAYPRLMFFEEKDTNGNIVYVVRKYFCDHVSYNEFRALGDEEQYSKGKYSALDKEELDAVFASFTAERIKEPLPIGMRNYEKTRDFSNTATTFVFEMEEWCKHISNKEFEDDKKDIYEAVQELIIDGYNTGDDVPDDEGWKIIKFAGKKEILYRMHIKENHTYYFLFDIALAINLSLIKNKYIDLSDERLLKQARKGYPDWILCGEFEDWKKLENDDEANLALSDEEIEVLNHTSYPYFVNGLAGSGKSTILYYLFAHAYAYKVVRPLDLLFLSYNSKLITKAKSVITALLHTNPSYRGFQLTSSEMVELEKCFWPFQDFLINKFLTSQEEFEKFRGSKHLSYEQFKTDYHSTCKLTDAKSYSAAIVWSVIRTFIKGRDYKSIFTIDHYRNLHKNDRTVDTTDFEKIYRIWKNWYKPTYEGEYWDDLDLVIYILRKLDNDMNHERYDIIYCDEVQDFTPIENELILRLSKYTNFDLKGYTEIPIAYAGDPNQTVTPTGFNWKRLKEIVDNTFAELIGNHIKIKERTLNNNYRSKRTIVEFANTIQYIRKSFLSDDVLKPQEQWNPQANPLPGFFFLTTNGDRDDDVQTIKAGFAKNECIITGADGEYERKLNENELTDDSTLIDDELLASIDNKTKLYTAISSKGLEFKAVLLYRFADQLPKSFSKILANEDIDSESDRYELSHFFTKLYIAVSRAKEVLYIADTQENYDNFWKYFIDNQFVLDLFKGKLDADQWKDKVGGIEIGDKTEYLRVMADNFNPLETALRIFEDAKLSLSPKDMNRAVGYFEQAGDYSMSEESKAYVLLYEKNYLASGEKFIKLGKIEEATKAFWSGCCWDKLIQHSNREIYKIAARFMTNKISLIDFVQIEDAIDNFRALDETWKQVVFYIDKQAKTLSLNENNGSLFDLCRFLEQLVQRGFISLNPTLADLYFRNEQFEKAINKWDKLAELNHDNRFKEHKSYYLAKEELSKTTSEKILWMHKGGKHAEILSQYSQPKDAEIYELDETARRLIFGLLLTPKTFKNAFDYPINQDFKFRQLYNTDRLQFLEHYVLSDFAEDKFVTWIEQPLRIQETDVFSYEIPQSIFERIFALPFQDWNLFMKLTDNNGYRVMKNDINYHRIADSICQALAKKNYLSLASCFLDIVFNNPHYNFANANKHLDTLISIFKHNEFTTKDFVAVTQKNKYFEAVGLAGHELDLIKDRLRSFVETKVFGQKRIRKNDVESFTLLCKIYEKVAPQIKDDKDRFVYDVEKVLAFYKALSKKLTLTDEFIKFINIRQTILNARFNKKVKTIAQVDKLLPNDISIFQFISSCDKEELLWLIELIGGKRSIDNDLFIKWGYGVVKAMYDRNIVLHDFERNDIKSNLKTNFIGYADHMIETNLADSKINEISIKLYAYLYEIFLDDYIDKAKKYDSLVNIPRLEKLYRLVDYFKQRALYYYSWTSDSKFKQMSSIYGISISVADIRKRNRPILDFRTVDEKIVESEVMMDNTPKSTTKTKKKTRSTKKSIDPALEEKLKIARNLKAMGLPIEQIMLATGLTVDETNEL